MVPDELGRLWISSDSDGVKILSRNADSIAHIGVEEGLVAGINFDLRKDSQQNLFFTSTVAGLNILPATNHIAHHLSTKDGLLDNEVWALLEDSKNRLWMGTYSGVNIITPDGRILQLHLNVPDFKNEQVDAIIQTGPDQFALTGRGSGLTLIDEAKHSLQKIGNEKRYAESESLPNTETAGTHLNQIAECRAYYLFTIRKPQPSAF